MRLAPLVLLAALVVGCTNGTRADPVTVETTTTAAPTSTRAAPATTRAVTTTLGHSPQCRDDAADIQSSTYLVSLEIDNFVQAGALGDIVSAQVHYENAVLLGDVALAEVDDFLSRCGSYARSAGTYNELKQGSTAAKAALAEMRRVCRANLAAFGFDC